MGCSIGPTYKRVSLSETAGKITTVKEIVVQPGLFVTLNPNKFQELYKVGPVLGVGGNSEVRVCYNRDTEEKRAVKIFRKFKQNDQEDIETKSEIRILKYLDHPSIIRVFEYFEDKRRIYLLMEYCSGGELFSEILKGRKLSEISIAKIMQQLFSALAYLHERKIIHRDIKPENILLEENENMLNIKLIDFGSAVICKGTNFKGKAGSYLFAAPEVMSDVYSFKCDMWSTGVILSLLLTGQPPYKILSQNSIQYLTPNEKFGYDDEVWDRISLEARDLLEKLLCDEKSRASAKECLSHPWIISKSYRPICNENILNSVLTKLRNFHSFHKLREAVYSFIISQFISIKETRLLREIFRTLDKNGDGKLSIEELTEQYSETLGDDEAKREALRIMKEVDTDNNGYIDYTEFLKVNLDSHKVLSNENLKKAFRMFDKDDSGTITAAELKMVLQGDFESEDSVWSGIVSMVDQNSDGEIDLQEFQDMILSNCLN